MAVCPGPGPPPPTLVCSKAPHVTGPTAYCPHETHVLTDLGVQVGGEEDAASSAVLCCSQLGLCICSVGAGQGQHGGLKALAPSRAQDAPLGPHGHQMHPKVQLTSDKRCLQVA